MCAGVYLRAFVSVCIYVRVCVCVCVLRFLLALCPLILVDPSGKAGHCGKLLVAPLLSGGGSRDAQVESLPSLAHKGRGQPGAASSGIWSHRVKFLV